MSIATSFGTKAILLASSRALLAGTMIALVTGMAVIAEILGIVLIFYINVSFCVRGRIQSVGENLKASYDVARDAHLITISEN